MKTLDQMRNKKGHIVIPCSRTLVVEKFKGYGICDFCSETCNTGFLIPVLGSKWYCESCKEDWEKTSKFYEQDVSYENEVAMDMMRRIALGV